MRIKHSIPQHNCFTIILPSRKDYEKRCYLANKKSGEIYELSDLNTDQTTKALLLDYYQFTMRELPDSICYVVYGIPSDQVKRALINKYPQLRDENAEVEVLILQKMEI